MQCIVISRAPSPPLRKQIRRKCCHYLLCTSCFNSNHYVTLYFFACKNNKRINCNMKNCFLLIFFYNHLNKNPLHDHGTSLSWWRHWERLEYQSNSLFWVITSLNSNHTRNRSDIECLCQHMSHPCFIYCQVILSRDFLSEVLKINRF